MDKDQLIKNIIIDCTYPCSPSTIDKLLDICELEKVKKKTVLIEEGAINSNLYITVEGVTRISYYDGTKEVTFGFGAEGSIFLSPSGFLKRLPAFFSLSSVTDCEILSTSKSRLDSLIKDHSDVLMLLFHIALSQFMSVEMKLQMNCKSTKERYLNLINRVDLRAFASRDINHVDILGEKISDKLIASYLGIIPTHLSNIKNEIMMDEITKSKNSKSSI